VTRNINLPDSLLSRFDMLFIVLDQSDTKVTPRTFTHIHHEHILVIWQRVWDQTVHFQVAI